MRPPVKDPYGRPGQQPGYGQNRRQGGYGQQSGYGQQRSGSPPAPEAKSQAQPANIRADIVWALRNAGGGLTVFDIGSKITVAGKPRYAETKIQHVLEMLAADGKVNKSEETGRVTYRWAVDAV